MSRGRVLILTLVLLLLAYAGFSFRNLHAADRFFVVDGPAIGLSPRAGASCRASWAGWPGIPRGR